MTDKNKKHQPPETRPQPEAVSSSPQEVAVETTRKSVKAVPARSPKEAKKIKQKFYKYLTQSLSGIDDAVRIRDSEMGQGIDLTDEIRVGFLVWLKYGGVDGALEIRERLGKGIDFRSLPGYADAVKNGFLELLKGGWVDDALKIRDSEFGKGIDFPSLPGYADAVKTGFLERLKRGYVDGALKIRDQFGRGIDFPAIHGYAEAVRDGFVDCLERGWFDGAFKIREKFGQGIDFTNEIKTNFLSYLSENKIDVAIKIRDQFGQGIDFTDEIKAGFFERLKNGQVDIALKIRDKVGQPIDFSSIPGYIEALKKGFFERLVSGRFDSALKIRKKLGQHIDFPSMPGYVEALKAGYFELIRKGKVGYALKIRDELGQGIDFASHPGYSKALIAYAKGKFPDFQSLVLGEEVDAQKFRGYKNQFWLPDDKVPSDEALLGFEALTCLAVDLVREEVKRKIRGLGYDTEAPGFSTRQMEKGHALETGRFREEVESKIRARFHAFASPALFDALKRRSGDEMRWVA